MADIPILLVVIILIALVFDYTNGAHDSANAIASVVSTRVLTPKTAVLMAGILNFVGAFMGTHVAETIGKGIVKTELVEGCHYLILAALIGAIFWNFLTLHLGIPSSSSYALIGGLMGAGIVANGWSSLEYATILKKIIVPLFLSPIVGFIAGYFIMLMLAWISYARGQICPWLTFHFIEVPARESFILRSSSLPSSSPPSPERVKTRALEVPTLATGCYRMAPYHDVPTGILRKDRISAEQNCFFNIRLGDE